MHFFVKVLYSVVCIFCECKSYLRGDVPKSQYKCKSYKIIIKNTIVKDRTYIATVVFVSLHLHMLQFCKKHFARMSEK